MKLLADKGYVDLFIKQTLLSKQLTNEEYKKFIICRQWHKNEHHHVVNIVQISAG